MGSRRPGRRATHPKLEPEAAHSPGGSLAATVLASLVTVLASSSRPDQVGLDR